MSAEILDLRIKTDDTLIDFEKYNSEIYHNTSGIRMRLSKNYDKKFFNTTWISSLIATASCGPKKLILTDWVGSKNNENINESFSDSLIGITSAYLADEILDSKHEKLKLDIHEIVTNIALEKKGMIDNADSGHTFTFCSFDSNDQKKFFPRPLALSAEGIQDFTDKFLKIKRNKIDSAFGINNHEQASLFNEYDTYQKEKVLAALVYELYENTIQHGNKDENNELIEGIRTFSIKRHIANKPDELKNQSESFNELGSYLARISKGKKNKDLKFYEISIVDNGIGIINRFLASRPEYQSDKNFKRLSDFQKLNFIITQSLSSKMFPGAGKGIKIALKNLTSLNGFVSLRTNDIWAFFDGSSMVSKISPSFQQVATKLKLDNMRGTSYNILIPVSS
jgi:hypothetical protein